jgi:hypothetical protein
MTIIPNNSCDFIIFISFMMNCFRKANNSFHYRYDSYSSVSESLQHNALGVSGIGVVISWRTITNTFQLNNAQFLTRAAFACHKIILPIIPHDMQVSVRSLKMEFESTHLQL